MKMEEFMLYLFGDKNRRAHIIRIWRWIFLLKSPVPGDGGGCGGVWGGAW